MKNIKKIGIVTEDVAELSQEIITKYQIGIAPAKLNWPEIEGVPGENIFEKMKESDRRGIKALGKTSQPSPKDYLDNFKNSLQNFEKILCITVSSKISGCYNSAIQGKKLLGKKEREGVFVFDSWSVSGGEGLIVLKALNLIEEGEEIENIIKKLEEFKRDVYFYAIFKDAKWIETTGRIPPIGAKVLGGMIKIGCRPLIRVKEGVITSGGIKFGAKDEVSALLSQFKKEVKKTRNEEKKIKAVISYTNNPEEAKKLEELIKREFPNIEIVYLTLVNFIIGSRLGPGGLTLSWTPW